MQITLRQARNLENRLRNICLTDQVIEVRAYDSEVSRTDIEEGVRNLNDNIEDILDLNDLRHDIRNSINIANMECGVSALLNTRDKLNSKRDILKTLGTSDNVDRQVQHISESPKARRMACVYTESMEVQVQEDLSYVDHQLEETSKELNNINGTVTITLEEDDVALLREYGYL